MTIKILFYRHRKYATPKARMNRRNFIKSAGASAAVFSIAPSHVLGGQNQVAPSEKLTMALVGCGTQGLRELPALLALPDVQFVAVCDPNKDSQAYVDWSKDGLRKTIATAMGHPQWRQGVPGIPGGREVAREMIETYYANNRPSGSFKGCKVYADFREMLDKETGLDAIKIMTPDHLHAAIAVAALRKGKRVAVHKPLANRLQEARWVIDTARQTGVPTHFLPSSYGGDILTAINWVREGAIGRLREIHNWSNRPVWPQYPTMPTDTPPVPKDFDWDLWLGPCLDRPYHPHYTNAVFRGWYDFGGGALADMGHYSLWQVFVELDLDAPIMVESTPSHICTLNNQVSLKIYNDYAFPAASTIRFKFSAKGSRPALDLFWYDGGMRPQTPDELIKDQKELPAEGMLFVGDQGKILAKFRGEAPTLISQRKTHEIPANQGAEEKIADNPHTSWVAAFKSGGPTYGNFLKAGPISEAFNLGAISLRLGGKRLHWDSQAMNLINRPKDNKYLTREYRPGWDLKPT